MDALKFEFSQTPFSYQTVDIYHASKKLLKHFGDHQLLPADSHTFLFREHASRFGGLIVHHIEFVGGVTIRGCDPHGNFLLHLMLDGEVRLDKGKNKKNVVAGEAFVLGPQPAPALEFSSGGHLLIVQVDAVQLEQHARKLIQHTPQESLVFPLTGFSSEQVKRFQQAIGLFLQQLNNYQQNGHQELWRQQVEQFLLSEILLKFHNSYSDLLDKDSGQSMPRTIRLAREYMDAHIANPISLDELCEAAEVSKRSLLYAFKQHCGTTPIKYLLALRLDGLHDELLVAKAGVTVTEVALKWGLNNPGRVSRYYQKRFGELPSATLAR
jgi:AraC-like DNA-binding protein